MDQLTEVILAIDSGNKHSMISNIWPARSPFASATLPFHSGHQVIPETTSPFTQSVNLPQVLPRSLKTDERSIGYRPETNPQLQWPAPVGSGHHASAGSLPSPLHFQSHLNTDPMPRLSPDHNIWDQESTTSRDSLDLIRETPSSRGSTTTTRSQGKGHNQRRPSNRDEFDGPHQFLDTPSAATIAAQERDLPHVPTNLFVQEQDSVLSQVNDRLSQCAFDFIAKYQFPIPLEPDKRPVQIPQDREWTEWVYLLKRLATKRRIPARVLYNGQIKQLVTVLENSLEMRHAAKHQSRPLKDDRNVLQLISAGLQVAKILKDASTMEFLDHLYVRTEALINTRRKTPTFID